MRVDSGPDTIESRLAGPLILVTTLILAAGLSEAGLRRLWPQPLARDYLAPDGELGSVHRGHARYRDAGGHPYFGPYDVVTNGHGLRMHGEVDFSAGRLRVLALGDSFTFGWGVEVESCFVGMLGSRLERPFPTLQLLNAGVGNYSTGHVRKALRRLAPAVRPAGAVYFMNETDLEDNLDRSPEYRVTEYSRMPDGAIALHDVAVYRGWTRFLLLNTPYEWLSRRSHLFVLAKRALRGRGSAGSSPAGSAAIDTRLAIDVALAHVRLLGNECAGTGLPLLILWLPLRDELEGTGLLAETFRQRLEADAAISSGGVQFEDPTRSMRARRAGLPSDAIFYGEGHYNRLGHRLYADAAGPSLARFVAGLAAAALSAREAQP